MVRYKVDVKLKSQHLHDDTGQPIQARCRTIQSIVGRKDDNTYNIKLSHDAYTNVCMYIGMYTLPALDEICRQWIENLVNLLPNVRHGEGLDELDNLPQPGTKQHGSWDTGHG